MPFSRSEAGQMSREETRQLARVHVELQPQAGANYFRYGVVLMLFGAVLNWLGLAQPTVEHTRYIGVICVTVGMAFVCVGIWKRWLFWGSIAQRARQVDCYS